MAQDLRYALRILFKDRAFSLTVLLTLTLCIGANAAIFAVVNSVLLKPLPVPEPERLVTVYNSYPRAGAVRASSGVVDYFDRLRETDVFEELAVYTTRGVTVSAQGEAERLTAMAARPSLFRLLRSVPASGRVFNESEGELGQEKRVILSQALAQRLFAGQNPIGKDLRLSGVPYQVVGVMPGGFHFMSADIDMWIPLAFTAEQKSDEARHSNNVTMIGRLKPGASVQQAQQQIDALNAHNLERFPNMKEILLNAGFHTVVAPLQEDMIRTARPTLLLLWAGVIFVLVIGAVNVTNLVLIRSSARMRELATRHALGAGLGRITRQLLTETMVLALTGSGLGLVLGYWCLSMLTATGLEALPRAADIRMDLPAVAYTMGLAVVVGLIVGLVPILNVRRMNLSQAFREEGRSGTSGRGARLGATRTGGEPGSLRLHAADRRGPAAGELPARARGRSRIRSEPGAHRARIPPGCPLPERRRPPRVQCTAARPGEVTPRCAGGRHGDDDPVWRRFQRQRDPGRGLRDVSR